MIPAASHGKQIITISASSAEENEVLAYKLESEISTRPELRSAVKAAMREFVYHDSRAKNMVRLNRAGFDWTFLAYVPDEILVKHGLTLMTNWGGFEPIGVYHPVLRADVVGRMSSNIMLDPVSLVYKDRPDAEQTVFTMIAPSYDDTPGALMRVRTQFDMKLSRSMELILSAVTRDVMDRTPTWEARKIKYNFTASWADAACILPDRLKTCGLDLLGGYQIDFNYPLRENLLA